MHYEHYNCVLRLPLNNTRFGLSFCKEKIPSFNRKQDNNSTFVLKGNSNCSLLFYYLKRLNNGIKSKMLETPCQGQHKHTINCISPYLEWYIYFGLHLDHVENGNELK